MFKKKYLLSLFIVFSILIFSMLLIATSNSFYLSNSGDIDNKKKITANIHDFFNSRSELEHFSDAEKSHMQDVKNLLSRAKVFLGLLGFCAFILIRKMRKEDVIDSFFYSGIAAMIFVFLIGIAAASNFDSVFTSFHRLFFPQGNWQFPYDSAIISYFTENFFIKASIWIAAIISVISLIFISFKHKIYKKK